MNTAMFQLAKKIQESRASITGSDRYYVEPGTLLEIQDNIREKIPPVLYCSIYENSKIGNHTPGGKTPGPGSMLLVLDEWWITGQRALNIKVLWEDQIIVVRFDLTRHSLKEVFSIKKYPSE